MGAHRQMTLAFLVSYRVQLEKNGRVAGLPGLEAGSWKGGGYMENLAANHAANIRGSSYGAY
jgi:hypothetical protein